MTLASIRRARCVTCRRCIQACPVGAISIDGDACVVDQSICTGCGACLPRCRTDAISMADRAAD